jgi:hypothetical protein
MMDFRKIYDYQPTKLGSSMEIKKHKQEMEQPVDAPSFPPPPPPPPKPSARKINHQDGLIHSNGQAFVAPGIDNRLGNQNIRIREGIKSETLTQEEVIQLAQSRETFNDLKDALVEDGELGKEDKIQLHDTLDKNSEEIYVLKHN